MQLSFGDAEGLGGRKRTQREVFLAEMEQMVPWKALLALIEPHYPKLGRLRAVFEVHRENQNTLAFNRRFGATETPADAENIHFTYNCDRFESDRPRHWSALLAEVAP